MCLIASYTEIEKLNQVKKVLRLLTLPVDTEEAKKNLLYNVSFMNNMVVKGYMKERTDADYTIYSVKDKALNMLIEVMPDRCHQKGTCLYVYAAGRQYSYHFMVNDFTGHNKALYNFELHYCYKHSLSPYSSRRRKGTEWNEIPEGYALSDAEYRQQYAEVVAVRRNRDKRNQEDKARCEAELNRQARIYMLRGIKVARQHNEEIRKHNTKFWDVIENGLTKTQKRTKAYTGRDSSKLYHLYGKKLGLTYSDCPRRLESWPVMTWGGSDYAYQGSCEGEMIWHRMIDIYRDYERKGVKKYII